MEERLLLDINEVSELTGFSVGTLYHWVSERRIPFLRVSCRCLRFRRADIESWLAELVEVPEHAGCKVRRVPISTKSSNPEKEKPG
jgi:excisionase family DNA binding protein